MDKILAIVGPTASGKSELAVLLAKKFNGEIISCDSRQIYRGLNLGTGKVPGKWQNKPEKKFVYKGVTHYCIDYVNPARQYSVAGFQKDARKAVNKILRQKKLPILCGGTGHWIDAVVYNQNLPDVKPDLKLRATLEKFSAEKLFRRLKKLDPQRAKHIDRFNKRRLIRALEIVLTTGKPVPKILNYRSEIKNTLWLGIKTSQTELYKKIEARLKQRLRQGMVREVKKLHANGLSWKKLESFGLEYRFVAFYLQKKLTYNEMLIKLAYAIKHYSKRQLTWWKKNQDINWIKPELKPAEKLVSKFIKPTS